MASSYALVYTVKMNSKKNIIFFDGHCGLCDKFVTKIFFLDKKHRFYFAPLQGLTASQILTKPFQTDSVIYWKDDKVLRKSHAALEILSDLGGFFSVFTILKWVPVLVRDSIYDYVAKNRYSWFGQSEICRLPNENEKEYFLS